MTLPRKSLASRLVLPLGFAVAMLLLGRLPASAAPEDDPFSPSNEAGAAQASGGQDPFSPEQQARPEPARGQAPALSRSQEQLLRRIRFTARVSPDKARRGGVVKLTITGTPLGDNHTYPLTERTPDQDQMQLSRVEFDRSDVFLPFGPWTETEPTPEKQPDGKVWLEQKGPFTWTRNIYIRPQAAPGAHPLTFAIRLMVCDPKTCTQPGSRYPPLSVPVEVLAGEPAAAPRGHGRGLEEAPKIKVVNAPPGASPGGASRASGGGKAAPEESGLAALLWSAFLGAFLMLLTPCVFPMIPITVNFFLKQSEKEHHRALPVATVYAGTIIILLTLVMVAFGQVIVQLANDPWFNLCLGAALVLFALSLFGMYDIQLPQGLARFTSAHEGRGGYIGAVFMALTFTVTSFTCTGPFLGAMLGGVAALKPPFLHRVLAALVYSGTFAAPFFLLALFPTLLKLLPKSGGWLNAIKVSMGFVELALALKFLANADLAWSPGNPRLFTYDSVLCAWIALSFACGLYLIGLFRLPHDEPVEHIGVVRMLFAALFFGLTVYLTPALRRETPSGVVGEKIVAFLPPALNATASAPGAPGKTEAGQPSWHMDYIDAWNEAVKGEEPKLIFIDFTGVNCTNCRQNELTVFPRPEVRQELAKYVRVQLYTDSVPNRSLSPAEAKQQAERNSRWRDAIGNSTNPYYVVFKPDKMEPFDKAGNLKGEVLSREEGTIFDVPAFVRFLKKPLEQHGLARQTAGNGLGELARK